MKALIILLALTVSIVSARGQSFNVDIGISGDPVTGGGAPSSSFGAAANQPGVWHQLASSAPWLLDLNGVQRNVSISIDGSNPSLTIGGFANLTNTGDYARLLNDAANVDDIWRSWTFHGLTNGQYRVVTYAVKPFPEFTEAFISLNGGPVVTTAGIMPGNQFILGVTHVIQETIVTDGTLTIHVARNPNGNIANVNGFQITAVPEPGTLVVSSLAMFGWVARRRVRSKTSN